MPKTVINTYAIDKTYNLNALTEYPEYFAHSPTEVTPSLAATFDKERSIRYISFDNRKRVTQISAVLVGDTTDPNFTIVDDDAEMHPLSVLRLMDEGSIIRFTEVEIHDSYSDVMLYSA